MRFQLDIFGKTWVFVSVLTPTSEEDEEEEFSGRQVQDTSAHHERVGFQPKQYETDGEYQ